MCANVCASARASACTCSCMRACVRSCTYNFFFFFCKLELHSLRKELGELSISLYTLLPCSSKVKFLLYFYNFIFYYAVWSFHSDVVFYVFLYAVIHGDVIYAWFV